MYTKLAPEIYQFLSCPISKSALTFENGVALSSDLKISYPKRKIGDEEIYDFRISIPEYCIPANNVSWAEMQQDYERYHDARISNDDYAMYLEEINSVTEIYTKEFHLQGKILDVGGYHGTTRYFLNKSEVDLYISVDPFISIFSGIEHKVNFLKAFPCINDPCNFLSCTAEYLPFKHRTFDWVHMRSVLDHFENPFLALNEAYRVLKTGGKILMGHSVWGGKSKFTLEQLNTKPPKVTVTDRIVNRFKADGMGGLLKAVKNNIGGLQEAKQEKTHADHHTFCWTYDNTIDLLKRTGFKIEKEHWQKAPYDMCIYVSAIKE